MINNNSGGKWRVNSTVFVVAMSLSALASAENQSDTTPVAGQINITWSATAGLGYDSNAYQAPRAAYVDYAALPAGSNPTIIPQTESGFFIPYEVKMDIAKNREYDSRLLGSASLDGGFYPGGGLGNANEYNVGLSGGSEYILTGEGKSLGTLYVGAIFEEHEKVYVDHESGSSNTTAMAGTGTAGRDSYRSIGVEAKYKHRTGEIDYSLNGQYILNDYQDPVVVSQLDHSYFTLGAEASLTVDSKTRLNLSFDHTVRDYSSRHARDVLGVYDVANPLLIYTYNVVSARVEHRLSPDWLLYLDYDHTRRTDNFVSYGDYRENRYGTRLFYEKGRLKTQLALHYWERDYPNGFAFDVAGQGSKYYSGNILKLRGELEQTKNTALWTELLYMAQNTADLRYDYARMLIMAGMRWAY